MNSILHTLQNFMNGQINQSIMMSLETATGQRDLGFWSNFIHMITPPEDIGTTGRLISYLFNYTTVLNIFYFFLVCLGLFGFSYLYHHKKNPKAEYTYGNKKVHIWVTAGIGLAVFLSIDLNITRISNNDLIHTFWNWPKDEENPVKVEILAQQWAWNFRYAGSDNKFNTKDDIVTFNELVVPVGKKIYVGMSSKDVIHALYLPNIRFKLDAIPGRVTRAWFEAKKAGDYDIACAEMCGTHHYLMKAKLRVLEPAAYEVWKSEAQKIALQTNDTEDPNQFWGWSWGS